MRLFVWNVNGLAATHRNIVLQHSSLQGFFDHHQADVICLQETKLQEEKLTDDFTSVAGYESFWACSKARKGYSGVCIWVSRKYSPLAARIDFLGDGMEDFDQEGRVILVDLESFVLINIYAPNAGDPPSRPRLATKLQFFKRLKLKLQELRAEGRELLIVGDFNVASTQKDLHSSFKLEEIYTQEEIHSFHELIVHHVDLWRHFHPEENNQFTVFNERKGYRDINKGLRIDYALASYKLMHHLTSCEIVSTPKKWSDHTALILGSLWMLDLENIPEVSAHKPCALSSRILFKKQQRQQTLLSMFGTDHNQEKEKE